MSENSKRARAQAEIAFSKTQTQHLFQDRLQAEQDTVERERRAKTARLREQRLAQEAVAAAAPKPAPKSRAKQPR